MQLLQSCLLKQVNLINSILRVNLESFRVQVAPVESTVWHVYLQVSLVKLSFQKDTVEVLNLTAYPTRHNTKFLIDVAPHRPNPLFFALQQILHEKVGCTAKASFACNGSIWAPNDKWVERGGKREREKERKCVKWPEVLPDVSPVTETDCSGRDTSYFWVWVTLKADDSMISIKEAVRDEEMSRETQSQRSQCNTRHTEKTKCLFLFFWIPVNVVHLTAPFALTSTWNSVYCTDLAAVAIIVLCFSKEDAIVFGHFSFFFSLWKLSKPWTL